MRFVCPLFLIAAMMAQEADKPEPSSIQGRIVSSITGEPVRKANVSLMPVSAGGGMMLPQVTTVNSDAEGKFTFENVEPGRYSLSGEKTGFVRGQYGTRAGTMTPGTQITISKGQKLTGLEFKLTPQAVITGKVLDEDGEPLARAMISVMRVMTFANQPQPMMGNMTNDLGEFTVGNITPGKYVLRAEYRNPAHKAGAEDYVATYYPSTTDAAGAVAINIGAGQTIANTDIRLKKGKVYRVSGKVTGITTSADARVQVMLQPQRRGGFSVSGGGNAVLKPDGTFVLTSVVPGAYNVVATKYDTGMMQALGRTQITVANENVEGVVVAAGSPLEISGKVVVEGAPQTKVSGSVMMMPTEGFSFQRPVSIDQDNAFKIAGVSRDKFQFMLTGLGQEYYVKSITAGDADVLSNGLDLSAIDAAPPIEIVLSTKSAKLEGLVKFENEPAAGAVVTLLPELMEPARLPMLHKIATTDQNGRYQFNGIAPGKYRLIATDEYLPVMQMDAEQLKTLDELFVNVELKEAGSEQKELKLSKPPTQ